MPSPTDNTSKWKALSEIDYFSLFMKNWLAFNSWYKGQYQDLKTDRLCINEVKNTSNLRNSTFTQFTRLIESSGREGYSFRDSMDGLATSLNRVTLINPEPKQYKGNISFENVLIDTKYYNLIINKSQTEQMKESGEENLFIDLGSICVTSDMEVLYKGTIELIYQIRCLLFHGQLEPTEDNHQIIKYTYLVMSSIMKSL
jgi:hypothetical protein